MKKILKDLYYDLGYAHSNYHLIVRDLDTDGEDVLQAREIVNKIREEIEKFERKYESPLYEALDGEEGE